MKTMKLFFKTGISVALGIVIVTHYSCGGNENPKEPAPFSGSASAEEVVPEVDKSSVNELNSRGEEVYKQTCQACHQANGEGLPFVFPPLAKSDYLLADKTRAIIQVIEGSSGEITVNGQKYNSVMPPQNLSDEQVADVLNYVLNSWGNDGGTVTIEEVKAHRSN